MKDDIRYMSHEVRIKEGYMKAPEIKEERKTETCKCGKTVRQSSSGPCPQCEVSPSDHDPSCRCFGCEPQVGV